VLKILDFFAIYDANPHFNPLDKVSLAAIEKRALIYIPEGPAPCLFLIETHRFNSDTLSGPLGTKTGTNNS